MVRGMREASWEARSAASTSSFSPEADETDAPVAVLASMAATAALAAVSISMAEDVEGLGHWPSMRAWSAAVQRVLAFDAVWRRRSRSARANVEMSLPLPLSFEADAARRAGRRLDGCFTGEGGAEGYRVELQCVEWF